LVEMWEPYKGRVYRFAGMFVQSEKLVESHMDASAISQSWTGVELHDWRLCNMNLAARKVSAVRWNIAANIVVAWIVTSPASGIAAALCYFVVGLFRQWIAPG
jgi:phosphate/sulfate permease